MKALNDQAGMQLERSSESRHQELKVRAVYCGLHLRELAYFGRTRDKHKLYWTVCRRSISRIAFKNHLGLMSCGATWSNSKNGQLSEPKKGTRIHTTNSSSHILVEPPHEKIHPIRILKTGQLMLTSLELVVLYIQFWEITHMSQRIDGLKRSLGEI